MEPNNIKAEYTDKPTVVINELRVVSADRSQKDLGDFKISLIGAESIYNPNRSRLYDFYDNVSLDGHLTGIIGKRIDAVINKNLFFEDKSGKRVEELDDLFEKQLFRDLMTKILETPLWGITGFEFIPGQDFSWIEIPRKHIRPHIKTIALDQNGQEGIKYSDLDNIWVLGKDKDLGLLLKCSPYVIWKRGNMGDWAQYVEIFGQPVRIIYYDAYDTKTKNEVRQVLDESGSSLALMIPKQAQFEMKDGKQSNGDGQLQDRFRTACNNELSVVILGNTETTTSSNSSGYAQSKEHSSQQLEITKSDIKYLCSYLNSAKFINILKMYGYPVDGGKFKFEKEVDLAQIKSQVEIIKDVKEMGTPVSDDHIYDVTGIPKPENYDALKEDLKPKPIATKNANTAVEDPENDPQQQTPTSKKKDKKSPMKNPSKKKNLLFELRALLADFFDPAL